MPIIMDILPTMDTDTDMPMQDIMDIPTMGMDIMGLDMDTVVDAAAVLEPCSLCWRIESQK